MADSDKVSDRFSASDSDVTFRSCDWILFQVHRKNLEVVSEGFAPPDGTGTSQHEIVSLTESGATLELLFQFIYPQRYPDLKDVDFKQLAALAEAAEKYQVYSAMASCNFKMGEAYQEHPHEVMMYAMRHGYADLMDKSERIALEVSQTVAFESFSPQVYIAWTRYYFQWMDLLASLNRTLNDIPVGPEGRHHYHRWEETHWFQWMMSQLDRPAGLLRMESFFQIEVNTEKMVICPQCKLYLKRWIDGTMKERIKNMRKLSSFL